MPSILSSSWMGRIYLMDLIVSGYNGKNKNVIPSEGTPHFSTSDEDSIMELWSASYGHDKAKYRPFASAPIRSKSKRTYDPTTLVSDPKGINVPMVLASLAWKNDHAWKNFKQELERFGSNAGIFDEIHVKRLGKSDSSPFQMEVRKFGKKRKGASPKSVKRLLNSGNLR